MANIQSGFSKFPWKCTSRKLKGTYWGLVKRIPDCEV